ncbi:MAG: ADP-forming succinate--CoA ligase subunit beta [Desulfofustis sp.]|nr:ADP-forming succinate--CoA ligase subunit beta [Desulfofustis sp.]
MKIHEYQAKELFRNYGVAVPDGMVCESPDSVVAAVGALGLPVAVKAQVHAGGRGKGGGVRIAKTDAEAQAAAEAILGMELVTQQTGTAGKRVNKVLVERGVSIKQELYLSLIVNRDDATVTIIASPDGGMNIEEVAARTPERIAKVGINPLLGIKGYHVKQVASALSLTGPTAKQLGPLLGNLYRLFVGCDCSLVEINPLIITGDDQLLALDAKIDIDSNSLFRHPEIAAMRDPLEEDPQELEAAQYDLNYIKLDGSIGNMVNGAGLAMATMDLIKQAGAEPANFLDVGGGANAEKVENGFRIILSDPHVKGILINIFGGILRCDVLAQGVVQAAAAVGLKVPVVVRMEGTNVDEGRRILAESGLDLINAVDLSDAATKVAAITGS